MNRRLPLFVASGIWSAMTPAHEANFRRLQVIMTCNQLCAVQHMVQSALCLTATES